MVATRRIKSRSRKNKSRHSYFMRGCSNSNKNNFFAKGNHDNIRGRLSSKKCKCACHLNKDRMPECKCNCHQNSKVFRQGMKGGDALNLSLAYTGKQIQLSPSPYAAYEGKGGSHIQSNNNPLGQSTYQGKGGSHMPGHDSAKAYPAVSNTDGVHMNWLNSSQTIRGGGMTGPGTSYANGLVGSSWSGNSETWPGVNGVGGDSNHFKLNTYNNDVSRQMLNVGANYPFNGMLTGGRRRVRCRSRGRKHKKTLRGGGLIPQNLVNVGRNFMYNIGASNNEFNGYAAPPNPMPYRDQLVTNNSKIFNL